MDKREVSEITGATLVSLHMDNPANVENIPAGSAVESSALVDLLHQISQKDTITKEDAEKLFTLLGDTPPSAVVTLLKQFITMDTAALITLAKGAPNKSVKIVIYLLVLKNMVQWVIGLIKARKEPTT